MEYRRFGTTDLMVSPICYGTMRYAAKDGSEDDRSRAGARALEAAIDAGVNFVHSSYEYRTRWLTGKVLAEHPKRHELHHIIKVNDPDHGEEAFSPESFRSQVEEALRDLHAEQIAVVQHLHRGTVPRHLRYTPEGDAQRLSEFDAVTEPMAETFERLREEGKVGYLTCFPHMPGYARRAIESQRFAGLVAFFNCVEIDMFELFPSLRQSGMGFIGIRPLAAGLLTNRRMERARLDAEDRTAGDEWARARDQVDELRRMLDDEPPDWAEFALRFAFSDPVAASTVIGISNESQLETALRAAEAGPLEHPEILEQAWQINRRYQERFGIKATKSGIPAY